MPGYGIGPYGAGPYGVGAAGPVLLVGGRGSTRLAGPAAGTHRDGRGGSTALTRAAGAVRWR